jgi:hypothetical protein
MTNTLVRRIFVLACALLLIVGAAAPALAQYFRTGRVLAFGTDTWRVWAPAGYTRVMVDGDGDTDLDCWVYDRFGNVLGQDIDSTDLCIINFRNWSSGSLTIRVRNLGSVYNDYELTVD